MTLSPRARLLFPLVWLPALGALALYIASRDWQHLGRQMQMGHHITWPPRAKPGYHEPHGVEVIGSVGGLVAQLVVYALVAAVALVAVVTVRRSVERLRRKRVMTSWELRLGRDDLANPYRVQEMFEGVAGAINARWYERLWRGCDHFAVEVHRLPDASIRFTIAAPGYLAPAIRGPLEDLYPDVELKECDGWPAWRSTIVRLKKREPFVLSIQTIRNYEHAFSESLVALLSAHGHQATVQLVLTPAPGFVDRRARKMLKRRERGLQRADHRDPGELGIDSVVEAKELKGALELQHRSLLYFDLRVVGDDATTVGRVAGLFSQLRSENALQVHQVWVRHWLYARRVHYAMPNPMPNLRTGVLSTSELATIWQLPRARVKHPQLPRHFANDVRDPERAVVLIDPKGPLAELCLGLVPSGRTVHYMDLGHPEVGINPLTIKASPGVRSAVFLQALIESNPAGSIQAASDSFLRQAVAAVCAVEPEPTLWHVYRMLDFGNSNYRRRTVGRLRKVPGADFAWSYWNREFPALIKDRGYAAQALNPPRNKIERLISTREIDTVLRHPHALDLAGILERGEVLVVAGAKAAVGEDNTILVTQILLQLLHREIQAQQTRTEGNPRRVSLLIDEAHNVLTTSVAKMLAEGRSAGLEAVFAWQYSAQIRDEVIRSGVRSLLQSISIFRMREIEDARSLAGLAMEVYSDRISVDQEEQERLRFSPDDVVKLPIHRAINLWVAGGVPRAGFLGHTLPMEELLDETSAESHLAAQRERGGYHPEFLADPIGLLKDDNDEDDDGPGQPAVVSPKPGGGGPGGGPPSAVAREVPGVQPGDQGTIVDVG